MFQNKKQLGALFLVGLFVLMMGMAHAQYRGPGSEIVSVSVQEIRNQPVNGQQVVLRGFIVRQLSMDRYEFMDDTAKIQVAIHPTHFFDKKIDERTRVELIGDVVTDPVGEIEIIVKGVAVVIPPKP